MPGKARNIRVAVIGAGVAGASCALSLSQAGFDVTVFEKSRGLGGRMSTRRAKWIDTQGVEQVSEFDHGAQYFSAQHAEFRTVIARAEAASCASAWQPRMSGHWPQRSNHNTFVATPNMPALCRYLLGGIPVRLELQVQRLRRDANDWWLVFTNREMIGPFDKVILAIPAPQAAPLLWDYQDSWAETLAAIKMAPCWTLMAVTNNMDFLWDAAEPDDDVLAWVARDDRKPGRAAPLGCATWVAQATPAWSITHLEDDAQGVTAVMCAALGHVLSNRHSVHWHYRAVHRWRYATAPAQTVASPACWWDAGTGLGVCGDFLDSADVEGAWRSGTSMAAAMREAVLGVVSHA
jgi:renalase